VSALRQQKRVWERLDPADARTLSDARLQVHHAAQLVAGIGVSYLPHVEDDSHTSMEWLSASLASQPTGARSVRLAVRPHPFALVVLAGDSPVATFALNGRTIADATAWIRRRVAELGLDAAAYTPPTHFTIPKHPVGSGSPFDVGDTFAFQELQRWVSNAANALESLREVIPVADPVRCWPHHFDIATLLTIAPGRTINVGLEPGDEYYDEPYWYASMYPSPSSDSLRDEIEGGFWHTEGWIGAVYPGSRMPSDETQQASIAEFLRSAINASSKLLLR
jgi:hypothetical protein